jgi:anti-sigma factor RsiW
MKNFRDIEQLSAYLDGQLSPSDSARIESRISTDPELASVLSDLRSARGILRKLPARKAPRNFTLTRQMVGLKPPMPRTFSFFRFSTAFATVLLMLTFAANSILPRVSFGAAAPMAVQESFGMGGGGEAAATEAPVATEAPLVVEAPAATEAPLVGLAPLATEVPPPASEDTTRIAVTPTAELSAAKEPEILSVPQDQPPVKPEAIIPASWQIGLLIVSLLGALIMFALRQSAIRKWK